MPGILKVYSDNACLKELELTGDVYEAQLGPESGIDCRNGSVEEVLEIWVKNTGDKPCTNTQLVSVDDFPVVVSTDNTNYLSSIDLGKFMPNDVAKAYMKIIATNKIAAGLRITPLTLRYTTYP